jgi:hypothetical protein
MGLLTDTQLRHSKIEGDPKILCHPNIPKPLHGINPRTHMGQKWWDEVRKTAYAAKDHHCWACGQHVKASMRDYLEAHESYFYNFKTGRVKLIEIVALCHECHSFIHNGLLERKRQEGEITSEFYEHIMNRGMLILKGAKLHVLRSANHRQANEAYDVLDWNDWHMIMPNGDVVYPDLKSLEEWEKFYGK